MKQIFAWDVTVINNIPKDKIAIFQQVMLKYWQLIGRHDLSWRTIREPWQILMAEILLRKTTSAQAVEVFEQIKLLTPEDIQEMEVAEISKLLKPLGIHAVRSQQLKSIAIGVSGSDRKLLESDEYLQSFKGIGRYISNSIQCYAVHLVIQFQH